MATPGRQDPVGSRPPRRQRGGVGLWWLWVVVLITIVWWAGWGWGRSGGYWWGSHRTSHAYNNAGGNGFTGATTNGQKTTVSNSVAHGQGNVARSTTAQAQQQPTGEGVNILSAMDKKSYIGKPFQVDDATVEKKPGNHAIWISENNGAPMLLVFSNGDNAANAKIRKGDKVEVTGTVEKAPLEAEAQHNWMLSANGAKRLEQQGAYIEAIQVHVAQQNSGQNG